MNGTLFSRDGARWPVWWPLFCVAAIFVISGFSHELPFTRPAGSARTDLRLIYVGAEDCAPCRAWQNGDGIEFYKSAAFSKIDYREIKSQHLRDVLNDENWPEDLRTFRSRIKRSDGVPLWLTVSGDEDVVVAFGAAAWRSSVLPMLRFHLRQVEGKHR